MLVAEATLYQHSSDTDTYHHPHSIGLQAGRGELLQRLNSKLKEWAPLLQRFLKSQDEQARATAAHMHCAIACLYVIEDVEEDMLAIGPRSDSHNLLCQTCC